MPEVDFLDPACATTSAQWRRTMIEANWRSENAGAESAGCFAYRHTRRRGGRIRVVVFRRR